MDNVDNVDNLLTVDNNKLKPFKFKQEQGINETNLMTLPFISLKRGFEKSIERVWTKSNNEEVSLKVVGGAEYGVPQIAELDVLLALFRIHLKNNENIFYKDKESNKIKIPPRIYFTFTQLAYELGYKENGGALKKKLEKSIKKLNEATVYTRFAILDAESKDYISKFKGESSCRILSKYCSYIKEDYKREKGLLISPYQVKDYQYVEVDNFFITNMCNNYYKVYDYQMYLKLKMSIAKKMFLILNTWSKGASKFITFKALTDYIGIDYKEKSEIYYAKNSIRRALKELIEINYIDGFKEENKKEGITIIFNQKKLDLTTYKDMFNSDEEIVAELRSYGVDFEKIPEIIVNHGRLYVSAVLRSLKVKSDKGQKKNNPKQYLMAAFEDKKWDVSNFLE